MKMYELTIFASLLLMINSAAVAQQTATPVSLNVSSIASAPHPAASAVPSNLVAEPDAPSAAAPVSKEAPTTSDSTLVPYIGPQDQKPEPNAAEKPSFRRPPLTRKFWLLWAPAIGFQVADTELSVRCARNYAGCSEENPIFGKHPSRERMYSIKLGYTAMAMAVSQKWWRDPHGDTRYSEALPIAFNVIGGAATAMDLAFYPWGTPKIQSTKTSAAHLSLGDSWIPPRQIPAAWRAAAYGQSGTVPSRIP